MASVADLASDPTARRLLRWWANHPWVEPVALMDRCEEMGLTAAVEWWREVQPTIQPLRAKWEKAPRRLRQRIIHIHRQDLVRLFGDFTCEPVDYGEVLAELPF